MRNVVIFGIGQIAEVLHYYLTQEANRNVVAFTVDDQYRSTESLLGLPVVGFANVEQSYPPETHEMFVAMSFKKVNKLRQGKVEEAGAKGYALASHVSPRATVWSGFVPNLNTIVLENNVVQPFAKNRSKCDRMLGQPYRPSFDHRGPLLHCFSRRDFGQRHDRKRIVHGCDATLGDSVTV